MENIIDLHIHSIYSDGTETPEDIVKEAIRKDLKYISLTDHESIEGYKRLLINKDLWQSKITVIPGVELHAFYKGYEIHVLGYFLDVNSPILNNKLKQLREQRTQIAYDTVTSLNEHGCNIDWDMVKRMAPRDIAITKAHIIEALNRSNLKFSNQFYFDFFNPKGKNYIPFKDHNLEEALQLIQSSKGLAILAHPALIGDDNIVEEIIASFQIGLEVYYHYFGDNATCLVQKYLELAKKYKLTITGGSDYHGHITPVEIGDTLVPPHIIEDLLKQSF